MAVLASNLSKRKAAPDNPDHHHACPGRQAPAVACGKHGSIDAVLNHLIAVARV